MVAGGGNELAGQQQGEGPAHATNPPPRTAPPSPQGPSGPAQRGRKTLNRPTPPADNEGMRTTRHPALRWTALTLAGLAAFRLLLRPRLLRWGATPAEARRKMPGDTLIPRPHVVATRAITVAAEPQDLWPLLPTLAAQDAEVVQEKPFHTLVMAVRGFYVTVTWAMELREQHDGTRLVVRQRILCRPGVLGLIYLLLSDTADFFTVREQLTTVKALAEGKPHRAALAVP